MGTDKVELTPEELYTKYVYPIATEQGVDPALVMGLINAESSFRSRAFSGPVHQARGYMQLTPVAVEELRRRKQTDIPEGADLDNYLYDPEINIRNGIAFLKDDLDWAKERGFTDKEGLAAYNIGRQKFLDVSKERGTDVGKWPGAVYVPRVLAAAKEWRGRIPEEVYSQVPEILATPVSETGFVESIVDMFMNAWGKGEEDNGRTQ